MVLQILWTLERIKVYLYIRSITPNNYSCIGETSHIWVVFLKQQKRQKDGKKYLSPMISQDLSIERQERKSGESMTYGKGCCGCAVLTICLIEDVGEVVRNCFFAEPQISCDLTVALTRNDEL